MAERPRRPGRRRSDRDLRRRRREQSAHARTWTKSGKLMQQGVGLACIHYAVEVPKGKAGDDLQRWIGGYFETFWSVNPFWMADFKATAPAPRGQRSQAFAIRGRMVLSTCVSGPDMKGVTPDPHGRPARQRAANVNEGSHSGNPTVFARKGHARARWLGLSSGPTAAVASASPAAIGTELGQRQLPHRGASMASSGPPGWRCRPAASPRKTRPTTN